MGTSLYLTPHHLEMIQMYRTVYDNAATLVEGLLWAVLIPVHYRESEFRDHGDVTGEGAFGCDVGGKGDQRQRINALARTIADRYHYPIPDAPDLLDADVQLAALVAAVELKEKASGGSLICDGHPDLRVITWAWWGYNGRSEFHVPTGAEPDPQDEFIRRNSQFSPYVSNDPLRGVTLMERSTLPATDGQPARTINRPDHRPGCLAIWRDLEALGLLV